MRGQETWWEESGRGEALERMRAYPEEKIGRPGCWFSLALSVCIVWVCCCCLPKLICLFYLVKSYVLLWICLNRFAFPVLSISYRAALQLTILSCFMFIPTALNFSDSPGLRLDQYSFCGLFSGSRHNLAHQRGWVLILGMVHMGCSVNS